MNTRLPLALLLVSLFSFGTRARRSAVSALVECTPRAGLPHFLKKLKTPGADVRIAYFGGSITAQEGWRPKTLAYFQKTYPQAKVSQINAAIGGRGRTWAFSA